MEKMSSPTDQKKPNRKAKADNLGEILSKYKGLYSWKLKEKHQKAFVEAVVNFLGTDAEADGNAGTDAGAEDNDNADTKGHVSFSDGARKIINESQCDEEVLIELLHASGYLKHELDTAQAKEGGTGNIDFYQVFSIPFFAGPLPSKEPMPSNKKKQQKPSRMSHAVSTVLTKQVFKGRNPVHFDIDFDHWDHQHSNVDLPAIAEIKGEDDADKVLHGYTRILQRSWEMDSGKAENIQLDRLMELITPPLKALCQFEGGIENNPDFHFSTSTGKEILYGEGKQLKNLPLFPPKDQLSRKLCIFGFATLLASKVYEHEATNRQANELTKDMKLKEEEMVATNNPPKTITDGQAFGGDASHEYGINQTNVNSDEESDKEVVPSPQEKLPKSILDKTYQDLQSIFNEVNDSLKKDLIQSHDALNLYMAVMQACIRSITHKKKYTMVVSQRVLWYAELMIKEGQCIIAISDGRAVGNEDFILDLAKFLTFVNEKHVDMTKDGVKLRENHRDETKFGIEDSVDNKTRADMSDLDQMMWQRALMHFPHFEDTGSFSTIHPPTPEEEHFFLGQEQEGINNAMTKSTLASPKERNVPQHRNVNVGNTHILGVDKYGPVPYLYSLTNIVRDIGYGRCGTVNEIIWDNGQSVAMKVYDLQDSDDHRDPYDVFLRERNTLFEMHAQKELKGCVPALIFHNPWWGCPSLGMELGRPVIEGDDEKWDDIDAWDEKDKIMLCETLGKLKKHGWVQLDHRGCNFVRLTKEDGSESIATIDMESVYRVDDPEKPFFLNVRF